MRTVKVKLAGQTYEIAQLPIGKAQAWRKALEQPFGELVASLEGAGGVDLTDLSSIAGVVRTFSGTLLGSIDILLELLLVYAPALAADRQRIEAEAYDDEALAAFAEVLKLAYPFGIVLALVNGSASKRTPSN